MAKTKAKEVTFRQKSLWQKGDCINRNASHLCQNESTLEAVCDEKMIRCCENEECMARAAELARS